MQRFYYNVIQSPCQSNTGEKRVNSGKYEWTIAEGKIILVNGSHRIKHD